MLVKDKGSVRLTHSVFWVFPDTPPTTFDFATSQAFMAEAKPAT